MTFKARIKLLKFLIIIASALSLQAFAQPDGAVQKKPEWELEIDEMESRFTVEHNIRFYKYETLFRAYCLPSDPGLCEAILDRIESSVGDRPERDHFEMLRAGVISGLPDRIDEAIKIYVDVARRRAGEREGWTALEELTALRDSTEGGEAPDDGEMAELLEKAVAADPADSNAGDAFCRLVSMQAESGRPLSGLIEMAADIGDEISPGYECNVRLTVGMLKNLARPWRSYALSMIIIFIPVFLFMAAKKLLFNAQDPGRGLLTPFRARVLSWVLICSLLPLSFTVLIRYSFCDVFLVHALGMSCLPGEASGEGAWTAVYMVLLIVPSIALWIMSSRMGRTPVQAADTKAGRVPWWLPKDPASFMLILMPPAAVLCIIAISSLLGEVHALAGFFSSIPAYTAIFLLAAPRIAMLYRRGPLPDGDLRDMVENTLNRFEVPFSEIWEADGSLKLTELLILPDSFAPVRCLLDPETLERFSSDEIHTLLLHQVGHLKMRHNIQMIFASLGLFAFTFIFFLAAGSIMKLSSSFLLVSVLFMTVVLVLIRIIALLAASQDMKADDFVIRNSGLYKDYLYAVLKLSGIDPEKVDLSAIDSIQGLDRQTRQRARHIIDRWQQAYIKEQ